MSSRDRVTLLLVIAVGGAVGTVGRWGISQAMPHSGDAIPVGTWVTNTTGAFAIGVLMALVDDVLPPSRYLRPFLGIGVLGGYTTFSTYAMDITTLVLAAQPLRAGSYLVGTMVTGLPAVWAGLSLVRAFVAARRGRPPGRERPTRPEE